MGTAAHRSRFGFPLILTLVVGIPVLSLVASADAGQGTNVILITVDTLRADHLGVYGYPRNTSPNLDLFAKEAVVFRKAFSHAPETNPSFSSLMTGHYPHETKVLSVSHLLPPGALTLVQILKANGYQTAAVMSHFTLRRGSGFERGFDVYDDQTEDRVFVRWTTNGPAGPWLERVAPKTTRAAIKWLEGNSRDKFFLWVHYDDPHGPYKPPAPYNTMFAQKPSGRGKNIPVSRDGRAVGGIPPYQLLGDHRDPEYYISQYDGEIRFFDEAFGELLQKIRQLRLLDNSLIIFTSDHGEGMGDHGYYFEHKRFVYNGLIHVPLILRLPGERPVSKEIQSAVAHVDVLPTILDQLGIEAPRTLRGQNLFSQGKEREIFSEGFSSGVKYVLIHNGLKLILSGRSYELYDLRADFAETINLMEKAMSDAVFASVISLKKRLDAVRRQDALKLGKPVIWSVDPETRRMLRSLGYVQ